MTVGTASLFFLGTLLGCIVLFRRRRSGLVSNYAKLFMGMLLTGMLIGALIAFLGTDDFSAIIRFAD